jgi:peptidase E
MNIYLTSYGVDTRYNDYMDSYSDIINVLKDKKVAIIPNAKLVDQDRTNSSVAREELNKNNITADIIDIDSMKLNINDFDALYLSGGEPKNLMDSIVNANLFNDIKNFIDNGGIIIGQSAGAMIFCKDYYDTTTKELLIMNNGYDYSDKMIVPHYNNLPKELKEQMNDNLFIINDNDRLIKLK